MFYQGGGGVATEREGGGFSGLNTKPDTDGQPYILFATPVRVSK